MCENTAISWRPCIFDIFWSKKCQLFGDVSLIILVTVARKTKNSHSKHTYRGLINATWKWCEKHANNITVSFFFIPLIYLNYAGFVARNLPLTWRQHISGIFSNWRETGFYSVKSAKNKTKLCITYVFYAFRMMPPAGDMHLTWHIHSILCL